MVPVAVVHPLEVVEVRDHDRKRRVEDPGPFELGLERLEELPPVDEARQLVGRSLPLDLLVKPCVLQRDPRLRGQPLCKLLGLFFKPPPGGVKDERRRAAHFVRLKVERKRLAFAVHVSDPADLLAGLEQLTSSRAGRLRDDLEDQGEDRKSTRLNSSHPSISYAVFCLKK